MENKKHFNHQRIYSDNSGTIPSYQKKKTNYIFSSNNNESINTNNQNNKENLNNLVVTNRDSNPLNYISKNIVNIIPKINSKKINIISLENLDSISTNNIKTTREKNKIDYDEIIYFANSKNKNLQDYIETNNAVSNTNNRKDKLQTKDTRNSSSTNSNNSLNNYRNSNVNELLNSKIQIKNINNNNLQSKDVKNFNNVSEEVYFQKPNVFGVENIKASENQISSNDIYGSNAINQKNEIFNSQNHINIKSSVSKGITEKNKNISEDIYNINNDQYFINPEKNKKNKIDKCSQFIENGLLKNEKQIHNFKIDDSENNKIDVNIINNINPLTYGKIISPKSANSSNFGKITNVSGSTNLSNFSNHFQSKNNFTNSQSHIINNLETNNLNEIKNIQNINYEMNKNLELIKNNQDKFVHKKSKNSNIQEQLSSLRSSNKNYDINNVNNISKGKNNQILKSVNKSYANNLLSENNRNSLNKENYNSNNNVNLYNNPFENEINNNFTNEFEMENSNRNSLQAYTKKKNVHKSSDFSTSNNILKMNFGNVNAVINNTNINSNISQTNKEKNSNSKSKYLCNQVPHALNYANINNTKSPVSKVSINLNLISKANKNIKNDITKAPVNIDINKINFKNVLGGAKEKTNFYSNSKNNLKQNKNSSNYIKANNVTDMNINQNINNNINSIHKQNHSNAGYVNLHLNNNFSNFQNNISNQLAKNNKNYLDINNSNNLNNNYNLDKNSHFTNSTNNTQNSYSNNYINKRYNMIKNSKNLFKENVNNNYDEKSDIKRIIDEELKLNNNCSSSLNYDNNDIERYSMGNLENKNNDLNNKVNRINPENFVVNKINSFPINYFQKSNLSNDDNESCNLEHQNNSNDFYINNLKKNKVYYNNDLMTNTIESRSRLEEDNLTLRYSNRINPLLNLNAKKMDLNKKPSDLSEIEQENDAISDKNYDKNNNKNQYINKDKFEETSFFMGAYPDYERNNTITSNADINNETIKYNYKYDAFKISNNFVLSNESTVQNPRATFACNFDEYKISEKDKNPILIDENKKFKAIEDSLNKSISVNENKNKNNLNQNSININNSKISNEILDNDFFKNLIYNNATLIETITNNKDTNIEGFLLSKNSLMEKKNLSNNQIIISKDFKNFEKNEEIKKMTTNKNSCLNESKIILSHESKNNVLNIFNKNDNNITLNDESKKLKIRNKSILSVIKYNDIPENLKFEIDNKINNSIINESEINQNQISHDFGNLKDSNTNYSNINNNNNDLPKNKPNYGYNNSINIVICGDDKKYVGAEKKKNCYFNSIMDNSILENNSILNKNRKIELKNYKNYINNSQINRSLNNTDGNTNKLNNKSEDLANMTYQNENLLTNHSNYNNNILKQENFDFPNHRFSHQNQSCLNDFNNILKNGINNTTPFKKSHKLAKGEKSMIEDNYSNFDFEKFKVNHNIIEDSGLEKNSNRNPDNIQIIINNNISYFNSNNKIISNSTNNFMNFYNKRFSKEIDKDDEELEILPNPNNNYDLKDKQTNIEFKSINSSNLISNNLENKSKEELHYQYLNTQEERDVKDKSNLQSNKFSFSNLRESNKNIIDNELITSNELKEKNFNFYNNKYHETHSKYMNTEKIPNPEPNIDYSLSPLNDFTKNLTNKYSIPSENSEIKNGNPFSIQKDTKNTHKSTEFQLDENINKINLNNLQNINYLNNAYGAIERHSIGEKTKNLLIIGIENAKKSNNTSYELSQKKSINNNNSGKKNEVLNDTNADNHQSSKKKSFNNDIQKSNNLENVMEENIIDNFKSNYFISDNFNENIIKFSNDKESILNNQEAKVDKKLLNENNNNWINLALGKEYSELKKKNTANSNDTVILFSNRNSFNNTNEEGLINKEIIIPTLNLVKKISSFNVANEIIEENSSLIFSSDTNQSTNFNLNEKKKISSNINIPQLIYSDRQSVYSNINNYIEEKLRNKPSNSSLNSLKFNYQNKTMNKHDNEKSDEDCTLSEDEKANITNVPIFKSKRFTSFNISNNSNSDLKLEKLDHIITASNKLHLNNANYETKINNNVLLTSSNNHNSNKFSKYLIEGFFKTLFINSPKTKNEICNFLNLKDLIMLSYLDKTLHKEIKEKIHQMIKNLIINEKNLLLRLTIWRSIFKYSKISKAENIKNLYLKYLKIESKYLDDILKDINRTMPEDHTFRSGKINNIKLKNILIAYSNYNSNIGYAQGLNFIVASAILILNEEEQVFLFIDALIKRFKFNKIMGMQNSQVRKHLDIIHLYLEKYVPKLCVFLSKNGLSHEFFSTNWIITCFANVVNHAILFKIWDFFVIYGWKFFNSFLISIMKTYEKKIISYDANYLSISLKALLKSSEFDGHFGIIIDKALEIMRIENFEEVYYEEETK